MKVHRPSRPVTIALTILLLTAGAAYSLSASGEVRDRTLVGADVAHAHLRGVTILESRISDSLVEKAFVRDSRLQGVTVRDATVERSRVSDASLSRVLVRASEVQDATLAAVTVEDSDLRQVHLEKALVLGGSITDSTLDRVTLDQVDLKRVSLCRVLVRDEGRFVDSGCADAPAAWPREGSFVRYEVESTLAPEAPIRSSILLVFQQGSWQGTCVVQGPAGVTEEPVAFQPLRERTDVQPGDVLENQDEAPRSNLIRRCIEGRERVVVQGQAPHVATRDGEEVLVQAWVGVETPEDARFPCDFDIRWDTATGLVLAFDVACRLNRDVGQLVDTDAPLGEAV